MNVFIVLVDDPTCFSSLFYLPADTTFGNMKSNVGKQSLKWGGRLTEAGAQPTELSTAGIQTGL